MWPEFEYSQTLKNLIEDFLKQENRKWKRWQILFFFCFLFYCVPGWMIGIDSSSLIFSFGQLYFALKMCIIQSMQERYVLKRFLIEISEERHFAKYLKEKGISEKWLADELEAMVVKCFQYKNDTK